MGTGKGLLTVVIFTPATGFKVIEGLLHDGFAIREAQDNCAEMDKIKTLLKDPRVFSILSDISQIVWGVVGWLNEAEICGNNIALRVFPGECNRPYTSASCDV